MFIFGHWSVFFYFLEEALPSNLFTFQGVCSISIFHGRICSHPLRRVESLLAPYQSVPSFFQQHLPLRPDSTSFFCILPLFAWLRVFFTNYSLLSQLSCVFFRERWQGLLWVLSVVSASKSCVNQQLFFFLCIQPQYSVSRRCGDVSKNPVMCHTVPFLLGIFVRMLSFLLCHFSLTVWLNSGKTDSVIFPSEYSQKSHPWWMNPLNKPLKKTLPFPPFYTNFTFFTSVTSVLFKFEYLMPHCALPLILGIVSMPLGVTRHMGHAHWLLFICFLKWIGTCMNLTV